MKDKPDFLELQNLCTEDVLQELEKYVDKKTQESFMIRLIKFT